MLADSKPQKAKGDARRIVDNVVCVEHSHHVPVEDKLEHLQPKSQLPPHTVKVDQIDSSHTNVPRKVEVIRVVVWHSKRGQTRIPIQKALNTSQFLCFRLNMHLHVAVHGVGQSAGHCFNVAQIEELV